MSAATRAFDEMLPARIDRAEIEGSKDITGIQWVFSQGGVTGQVGPTGPLADALNKAGIPWSVAP